MATTTPARPDVPSAESTLQRAVDRYQTAQVRLQELERANPRERSRSAWVLDHDAVQHEVVDAAVMTSLSNWTSIWPS